MSMKQWMKAMRDFWKNEDGIGTLEIVLIIAVLIALAVIFRKWILAFLTKLTSTVENKGTDFIDGK